MAGFDLAHRVALLLELLGNLIHGEPLRGRTGRAAAAIAAMFGTSVLVTLPVAAFAVVGGEDRNGDRCEDGGKGLVSRESPVQTAVRNCTGDEGGPFGFGDQVADPKPPQAAVVKSHGGERCGNVGTTIPAGTVHRFSTPRRSAATAG